MDNNGSQFMRQNRCKIGRPGHRSANGVFYDTTYPPAPTFIFFLEMGSPQSSTVTMARKG